MLQKKVKRKKEDDINNLELNLRKKMMFNGYYSSIVDKSYDVTRLIYYNKLKNTNTYHQVYYVTLTVVVLDDLFLLVHLDQLNLLEK